MRYVEETSRDKRHHATNNTDSITGPLFTTENGRTAIIGIKDGKVTGPDNFFLYSEVNGSQKYLIISIILEKATKLVKIDICDFVKNAKCKKLC